MYIETVKTHQSLTDNLFVFGTMKRMSVPSRFSRKLNGAHIVDENSAVHFIYRDATYNAMFGSANIGPIYT